MVGLHLAIVRATESINQFALLFAFKDVLSQWLSIEIGDTQFFAYFPLQSLLHILAQVDVTSASRIPFARLYVFPFRSFLQIEFAPTVEKMQVDDGVKGFRAVVCFPASNASQDVAHFVDQREQFFLIVFHVCGL